MQPFFFLKWKPGLYNKIRPKSCKAHIIAFKNTTLTSNQFVAVYLTNGHEVEIFMNSQTRNFSGFVARNCRKDPSAERVPAVSLVKVPDLNLQECEPLQ